MIRIGIIGLDSTHAVEFTRWLNSDRAAPAARVVAACAGIDTDFPLSVQRRAAIERRVREEFSVPIVPSSEALLDRVDAVMLLSCDGRSHAAEIVPLLAARKPLFVDKPLSADWREAARMLSSARSAGLPCFSASALRYRPGLESNKLLVQVRPAKLDIAVPAASEPGHPDLSWHGIHGVDTAYALLGSGCRSVRRTVSNHGDLTVGTWPEASEVAIRRVTGPEGNEFQTTVNSAAGVKILRGYNYQGLLGAVVRFFQTGNSPVSAREMIEVLAFIAAADESRDAKGASVDLTALLAKVGPDLVARVASSPPAL